MLLPDTVLNFRLKDIYFGFAICEGILFLTKDSVIIEYYTKDSVVGLLKSDLKTIKIDFSEIINAEVKSSIFSRKLIIRLKSLGKIIDTPFANTKNNAVTESNTLEIPFKFGKETLFKARSISAYINEQISNSTLENIENEF
ncbi:hypothetical protein D9V87_02190 [Bacteroidetes/Chlorobi group bacterium MS-B_bin-24]|nr:MAG: hypothetical protein D9V87_02190 [Bacteroidetes/Chlorobi group bacterium MS-B_bin-24]